MSGIDYYAEKDATNVPKLVPGEETYLWQDGVVVTERRASFPKSVILLTTYNIYWYSSTDGSRPAYQIPLHYVGEVKASVWIRKAKS